MASKPSRASTPISASNCSGETVSAWDIGSAGEETSTRWYINTNGTCNAAINTTANIGSSYCYTVKMDADAIVIGAGAAGLAAARTLARQKARVVVLEARGRIGGRVWSRPGSRPSTPAELGAEFIHAPALKTFALLREAGAAAVDTGGESWTSDDGKLVCDDDEFLSATDRFAGVFDLPHDESVDVFLRR